MLAQPAQIVMLPTPLGKSPERDPVLADVILTSHLELAEWNVDGVFDSFVIRVHHAIRLP